MKKKKTFVFFIYISAVLLALYTILPISWLLITSFKTRNEIYSYPPTLFPKNITIENYTSLFQNTHYDRYFFNSIIISITAAGLITLFAVLSAYAYSNTFTYRFKKGLMVFIIIARMIPEIAIIIPLYFMINKVGLFDTKTGVILMISAMAYPLAVWLLKSFFDDIPTSLYDAAKIDGCGDFSVLKNIVLPISGPSLSSTIIITFLTVWNSFLIPLTFTKSLASKTFPLAISELAYGEHGVNWGNMASISVLAVIPMFLLGIFTQRYIIAGLTYGAEKG
jgi:ABC-type glycerol-3-phosphate transport system permease component